MTVTINLALQGGGAHGAFTWGALDRLLEEGDIEIDGITATSAGAMNAAAVKRGWVMAGRDGAREWLERFWLKLTGLDGPCSEAVIDWLRTVSPTPALTARLLEYSPAVVTADAITRVLSPYQFNPTNYHPLRAVVEEMLDADGFGSTKGPKLFINATNVRDGKPRVFVGREITADAILASACLPTLYQAIEIDDPKTGRREAYWDGGYTGNPALYPLFYRTKAADIVIVHINPLYRDELPRTSSEIATRINEISFNASLLRELRNIDFVNRLIDRGVIAAGDDALQPCPLGQRRHADEHARHRHQDDDQPDAAPAAQGRRPRRDGGLPRQAPRQARPPLLARPARGLHLGRLDGLNGAAREPPRPHPTGCRRRSARRASRSSPASPCRRRC